MSPLCRFSDNARSKVPAFAFLVFSLCPNQALFPWGTFGRSDFKFVANGPHARF